MATKTHFQRPCAWRPKVFCCWQLKKQPPTTENGSCSWSKNLFNYLTIGDLNGFRSPFEKSCSLDGNQIFSISNNWMWKNGHVICFSKPLIELYVWWPKATKIIVTNDKIIIITSDWKMVSMSRTWRTKKTKVEG